MFFDAAKNEGDKPAMLLGRSSVTAASQQHQPTRFHSKNVSSKSSNPEFKVLQLFN